MISRLSIIAKVPIH